MRIFVSSFLDAIGDRIAGKDRVKLAYLAWNSQKAVLLAR